MSQILNILGKILQKKNGIIVFYNIPHKKEVFDLTTSIYKDKRLLLGYDESYNLFQLVKNNKIEGDIAEAGVFSGGSAKLICEAKGNRTLYLFDNFEDGLPDAKDSDEPDLPKGMIFKDNKYRFQESQFSASYEDVNNYLKTYNNVWIFKGDIQDTFKKVKDNKFALVHIDLDLYDSTKTALEFFYPRMNQGGIILLHDYNVASGVKKCVDEFFKDKQESIIEMSGTQCMIVKK